MNGWITRCSVVGAALLAASTALAEDMALIIANSAYKVYPAESAFADVVALRPGLQEAGFRTVVMENLSSDGLVNAMPEIGAQLLQADRVVVVTSGYYASNAGQSWLLTTDADQPDIFTVGQQGLPLDALLSLLADKPGKAIFAHAGRPDDGAVGWRLTGFASLDEAPQGVTLLTGSPARIAEFLPEFLVPGRAMGDIAWDRPDGVQVLGFLPLDRAFLAATDPVLDPAQLESELWDRLAAEDTVAAYERYRKRYPDGVFSEQASARIAALTMTPEDHARLAEGALDLDRDRQRQLQRYLTILGFDTQGVDGVFGPNTRAAISAWQASLGAEQTGYLSGNQVSRLEQDGTDREEVLRLERLERERTLWGRIGSSGSEGALQAYLEEFPDGRYVDEAEAALERIADEKRRLAAIAARADWNRTVAVGTLDAYRDYLRKYPASPFAAEARARVQSLSGAGLSPTIFVQP